MKFSYLIFPFFNDILEFVVAVAVIAWLAQDWKTNPNARVARWIVGNRGFWLPIALAEMPPILAATAGRFVFQLFAATHFRPVAMVTSYALSMFSGVLLGMAAASCAAPVDAGGQTRLGRPVVISAALIFMPLVLIWLGPFHLAFALVQRVFLSAIIVTAAHLLLGGREAPAAATDPTAPRPAPKSTSRALLIGFAPSALALTLLPLGSVLQLSRSDSDSLLWMLCAVSIVCCFVASGMLFARRTGGAVLGGILFLLLNGFIAFFFGCCASLKF